jgi:hypothetical protein
MRLETSVVDPDWFQCGSSSGSGSRDLMEKIFLYQKIAIHLSQVFMKDILATGEAPSPQKTTPSTSKY